MTRLSHEQFDSRTLRHSTYPTTESK
jgi:hypothetical protein